MNILFLSTWFPYPPDNGSKLRVLHLIRALGQVHNVSLISFAFASATPHESALLRQWCQQVDVVDLDPFVANRAGVLPTFLSLRPVASRPIAAMSRQVTQALAARSFEIVIASTEMMADYALLLPRSTVKVLEEHNSMVGWARDRYDAAEGLVQRARCWLSWQKSRSYQAHFYPNFDLITMVSEQDRTATLDAMGPNIPWVEVVPNGVDCTHNRPSLARPQSATLVYNGSLTYNANYDAIRWFLKEIYPHIKTQVPTVTLKITGSMNGVDLSGLALDNSVHLTGLVQDVRIPVTEATVCIAPIRQGGGTRLKILEAMALGTPVVATSKAAEGLMVTAGVHLLLADDPTTFATLTVSLLNDTDLRYHLTRNARDLVEQHYDWNALGKRFVNLVEATVETCVP